MPPSPPLPAAARPASPPRPAGLALSIIIPTYNEAATIAALVAYLRQPTAGEPAPEIIVADGGSTDTTRQLARQAGATVLRCPRKGRAAQMNHGARQAQEALLYFLHADSYPPAGFRLDLQQAVAQGYGSGCFRLAFDDAHWLLRFSAWCTRLPLTALRFGDQSLFVRRELFERLGGFREELLVMEDQEIIRRLQAQGPFCLVPRAVLTSARKYRANGVVRLQSIFTGIALLYWLGVPQRYLVRIYQRFIK